MNMNWFEKLESQLNEQLESFLSSNPEQKKLLDQEELEERQRKLSKRHTKLKKETELLQQELLGLAPKIDHWKNKLKQAQQRKEWKLIEEASRYEKDLMNRGNIQWQALKELEFELVQLKYTLKQIEEINSQRFLKKDSAKESHLENSWDQFETQQELEYLRRQRNI
uniref:Uncharacterized protein n=1 Tax=Paulinella longichromatophora TaxID=1708747 RepID=A0A2H4ZPN7_9EUKA|nr:hypothetical protein PLO_454 [Paulinella longichromatophora]